MAMILCPLHAAARRWGDAQAIDGQGHHLTYVDLDARVSGVCQQLTKQGVKVASHVAYCGDTQLEALLLLFACARLGAVFVPLSGRFPEHQRAALSAQLALDFGYFSPELTMPESVQSLQLLATEGERVWHLDGSQAATMILTSGSTGTPKAVLHSTSQHLAAAEGSFDQTPLQRGDRWLLSLPLYHVGGLAIAYRCLLSGATMVLPEQSQADDCLAAQQVSHVSMVATQLQRLLNKTDAASRLSSVNTILLGGGPIPQVLLTRAAAYPIRVLTSYGMTEMGSQICAGAANERGLSGSLLAGRQLRIDEQGIIEVRGDCRFIGYYQPQGVQYPFDAQGWFRTSDRGRWVEEQIQILGRSDNMFISGGENIQPEAIEAVIGRCQGVQQVVVVAVPCTEYGQRPIALIEGDYQLAEINKRLAKKLPRFMHPQGILPWPAATSADLKVNRQALQAYAIALWTAQ